MKSCLLIAAFASAWASPFSAVKVTPTSVSVQTPGRTTVVPSVDFAQNLSFQVAHVEAKPSALSDQLRWALREQVDAGVPRDQALATQIAFVEALSDTRVLDSIVEHLHLTRVPSDPTLGPMTAQGLARVEDALQSVESRAQMRRYNDELLDALTYLLANDDSGFARLFDGSSKQDHGGAPIAAGTPHVVASGLGRPFPDFPELKAKLEVGNPGQERAAGEMARIIANALLKKPWAPPSPASLIVLLGQDQSEMTRMGGTLARALSGDARSFAVVDARNFGESGSALALRAYLARAAAEGLQILEVDQAHELSTEARRVLKSGVPEGKLVVLLTSSLSKWVRAAPGGPRLDQLVMLDAADASGRAKDKIKVVSTASGVFKSPALTAELVLDNPGQEVAAERITSALAGAAFRGAPAAVILLGDDPAGIIKMTQAVARRLSGDDDHISSFDVANYKGKAAASKFGDDLARAAGRGGFQVIRLDNGHLISKGLKEVLFRAIRKRSLRNSSDDLIPLNKTVIFLTAKPSEWSQSKAQSKDSTLRSLFQSLAVLAVPK